MVQIIHHYNGVYPFGKEKESEHTFMQVSKTDLTENEIAYERQKAKIIKSINSQHFIKLIKTLKEDSNLHFIYQYEITSLETYIENLKKSMEGSLSKEKYKFLITQFKNNIDDIVDILVKLEIKADVFLSGIACLVNPKKEDTLVLKAFIDPDAEYLSIMDHQYRPKEGKKKDRSGINQEYLNQFYQAERKRLMLDFEQLLEKTFGKLHENQTKKQFPNFVINGTKLVFMNTDQKEREYYTQTQGKNSKIEHLKTKEGEREKIPSKMESSKKTGASERSRNSSPSGEQDFIKAVKNTGSTGPIIDFDQSFEPEFKPQEFLKEKTYIYEEDDYLNSLEEELTHMALEKKEYQQKKTSKPEIANKKQERKDPRVNPMQKNVSALSEKQKKQRKDLMVSLGSTQSNTYNFANTTPQANQNNTSKESASLSNNSHSNNNLSAENISNKDSQGRKTDSKDEKVQKMNKYKMKIITSHQIEIEGGGEEPNVEEIQKQIMEQIRTGKINIHDFAAEKQPPMLAGCKSQNDDSREKPGYISSMYNSDHRDENKSKDSGEPERKGKVRHDSDGCDVETPGTTKGSQMTKMKNISQILEKIGVKNNAASQHNRERERERETQTHLSQVNVKSETKKQIQSPSTPTIAVSIPQHRIEKGQKMELKNEEKKAEKYMDKIKQAKSKAEQLLKQYTKKKQ